MLKLMESISFFVLFFRIYRLTNSDTSDNMSVDLFLRSKLFGRFQKKREYSKSIWWRGNQVLKSSYSFDSHSSVVTLLLDNKAYDYFSVININTCESIDGLNFR